MQLEQAWNELVEATRDLEAHRALFASASKTFDEAQRSVYASEDRMYKARRTIEELAKAAAFPPDQKMDVAAVSAAIKRDVEKRGGSLT